ncbi:MAG: hypothetical protein MJ252_03860 [archaeon]|nr:hypothetical protein [archaeon]
MKWVSRYNSTYAESESYINYFRRPYFSRFLMSASLQLYSFNSCVPLPSVVANYNGIDVTFYFHLDSLLGVYLDAKKIAKIKNKPYENVTEGVETWKEDQKTLDALAVHFKPYTKKISFFYVVDTLIKDTLKEFEKRLKLIETSNFGEIAEKYHLIINSYLAIKKNRFTRFVLKVCGSEEYLYGDYTLGSFDFMRNQVRQHYGISLIIKAIPCYKIQPYLSSFPPILIYYNTPKNGPPTYEKLLKDYIEKYPEREIIYRLYRPEPRQIVRYLMQEPKRMETLTKFTESGDCDINLSFKFHSINNAHSFSDWFDLDEYAKCKLIMPFFNPLKNYEKKTKKIKKRTFMQKLCCVKESEEDKNEREAQEGEEKEKKKILDAQDKKKKDNKRCEDILNYLTIYSKKGKTYEYNKDISKAGINNSKGPGHWETKVSTIVNRLVKTPEKINKADKKDGGVDPKTGKSIKGQKYIKGQKGKSNKVNMAPIEKEEGSENSEEDPMADLKGPKDKFKVFKVNKYDLPHELEKTVYVRIKLSILYGCFELKSLTTKPFLFSDTILVNERITFDTNFCLISHLPLETRIGITIQIWDATLQKDSIVLGSCQIPLYRDTGEIQQGYVTYNLWPNAYISPRINNSTPFMFVPEENRVEDDGQKLRNLQEEFKKKEQKKLVYEPTPEQLEENIPEVAEEGRQGKTEEKKETKKKEITIYDTVPDLSKEKIEECLNDTNIKEDYWNEAQNSMDANYKKMRYLRYIELDNKWKMYYDFVMESDNKVIPKTEEEKKEETEEDRIKKFQEKIKENKRKMMASKEEGKKKLSKIIYPSITVEFPKFSVPLIHTNKTPKTYRDFLRIKSNREEPRANNIKKGKSTKPGEESEEFNDYPEIRKMFGNCQKELINFYKEQTEEESMGDENIRIMDDKQKDLPKNLWNALDQSLPQLVQLLKKDPFEKLNHKEIVNLLICRDYISSIPSALELFLRVIDWRNPLEVSIAHTYLQKWAPIGGEDAMSLLDARYPDSAVREYAISRLRILSDQQINSYMLMLCQSLLYETFLINPLADFIIERSLLNPKLIGNSFLWNSRINSINPLFAERLSAYLLQMLLIAGNKFLAKNFDAIMFNYFCENATYTAKITKVRASKSDDFKKYMKQAMLVYKITNELQGKKFYMPLDPTFLGTALTTGKFFLF